MRLVDGLLRGIGLIVWAVVGAPTWLALLHRPPSSSLPWLLLYLGFAATFVLATDSRRRARQRLAWLSLQSAAAGLLALLGMPHFEGALFAVVAAQTPSLVRPAWALGWSAAQAMVLAAIILPSHGTYGTLKATGEYAAFSLFSMGAMYLREREAAARRHLAATHAALLAAQALLSENVRAGERLRVSREVHDAIGHGLVAANLHLQLAARGSAKMGDAATGAAVRAAQEAVQGTLREVRSLVGVMRVESRVELSTALRALCAGVRMPRVTLTVPPSLRIDDAVRAQVLVRCVQEALTNAMKHARAEEVWVTVERLEGEVVATVRDDGVGVPVATSGAKTGDSNRRGGHGLEGLRERLDEVGGRLAYGNVEGGGFSLRAAVPSVAG